MKMAISAVLLKFFLELFHWILSTVILKYFILSCFFESKVSKTWVSYEFNSPFMTIFSMLSRVIWTTPFEVASILSSILFSSSMASNDRLNPKPFRALKLFGLPLRIFIDDVILHGIRNIKKRKRNITKWVGLH